MIKRLFLGTAAAVVATAGVQAADLPVAEPVEYVRICDTYGTGFYYIPGTETCLRIGGYVRVEARFVQPREEDGSRVFTSNFLAPPDTIRHRGGIASTRTRYSRRSTRDNHSSTFRARARIQFDARTETEWGTLRSFIRIEITDTSGGNNPSASLARAFIEFQGFTAGKVTSFFDFYTGNAMAVDIGPSVSDATTLLFAYTASFGNGINFTVSIEDGSVRRNGVFTANVLPRGLDTVSGYQGHQLPDIVAALRISQGWGSAQIMGAVHEVSALDLSPDGFNTVENKYGWAVGAGVEINLGFLGGSTFFAQGSYSKGATSYAITGSQLAGVRADAIVSAPRFMNLPLAATAQVNRSGSIDLDLTTAWSVAGGFSFAFTPTVSFVIEGSYGDVEFGGNTAGFRDAADWTRWNARGSIFWKPVSGLTLGVGVGYEKLNYASTAGGTSTSAICLAGGGACTNLTPNAFRDVASPDIDIWEAVFRIERDF